MQLVNPKRLEPVVHREIEIFSPFDEENFGKGYDEIGADSGASHQEVKKDMRHESTMTDFTPQVDGQVYERDAIASWLRCASPQIRIRTCAM